MRLRFWLGLTAVAAVAIGAVLGALAVRSNEHDAFEQRQREEALRSAHQAEAVAALSVGQLASAVAFYQVESDFNRHEFGVMSDSLLDGGALAATAFVQVVPRAERARFERSHGFQIVDRAPLGLRRADSRAAYFPLTLAATDGSLEAPLGYDVGGDSVRGSILRHARDSGMAAATPVMRLPIGGTGINVIRPVYRDGAPTETSHQRRAALLGFAIGAFHLPDLAAAATSALPKGIDVALLERGKRVTGPDLSDKETAAAPIRIADRTWLLVAHDPKRPDVSLPVIIAVFGIMLAILLGALVAIWTRNERVRELQRQASQDPLTGLKNRRRFEEDLRTEMARSRRDSTEGALLMLDLDNFKRVNDTLGHPAGDRVISEIGDVLHRRMRETDVVARLGGDEFAIVLPRCDLTEARSVAGEIATAIREHTPRNGTVPPVTASIGVALFGNGSEVDFDSLQEKADAAMYEAKRAGRDAVRVASPPRDDPAASGARSGKPA